MTALAFAPELKLVAGSAVTVAADGVISGYASLFGVPDLGRDVVLPGAFRDSLARRGAVGIRMLWQHDPAEPIGRWISLAEDSRGLRVRGRLSAGVARARELAALVAEGAVDGLSIGFRTVEAHRDRASGLRRLARIDLWEISLVTFPMQPGARLDSRPAGFTRAAGFTRVAGFAQASGFARAGPAGDASLRLAVAIRRAASSLSHRPHKDVTMSDLQGIENNAVFENKAAHVDVAAAYDDLARTFEAFKQENDEKIAGIETRMRADVVRDEKIARIDAALDDSKRRLDRAQLDARRPALGSTAERDAEPGRAEHKAAFDLYVRAGEATGLKGLEAKALSAGSGPDGGYLVPPPVETEVLRRLAKLSPIRAISSVQVISSGLYKRAFSMSGPASGWVGETAPRPQTDAPTLAELAYPAMELYAMPAATQTLLDDSIVNIDDWLASEVETAFAEQEGTAFVTGDGVNKPKGFLTALTIADTSWSWGKLGTVATGNAGAFPAENPADSLIDLVYALRAGYRQNASFVMNRRTQSTIRKFKDESGAYLWQPPATAGAAATLMSFPVVESEDMPDIVAGSLALAFGDFRRGYLVVDRAGIRVLRDPYSAKPYVLFYTTKRVGGGVQDYAAIKLMKFAVS